MFLINKRKKTNQDQVKDYTDLWLKLMFFFRRTCHQKPERSFTYNGYQFPFCARCTGIYIGYLVGLIVFIITIFTNLTGSLTIFAILILPTTIDGLIQNIFKKESTNRRRFITGIMAGTGLSWMFLSFVSFVLG